MFSLKSQNEERGKEGEGRSRVSAGVDEEVEEVEEGREDSISNVQMDAGQGPFIADTGDDKVGDVEIGEVKDHGLEEEQ